MHCPQLWEAWNAPTLEVTFCGTVLHYELGCNVLCSASLQVRARPNATKVHLPSYGEPKHGLHRYVLLATHTTKLGDWNFPKIEKCLSELGALKVGGSVGLVFLKDNCDIWICFGLYTTARLKIKMINGIKRSRKNRRLDTSSSDFPWIHFLLVSFIQNILAFNFEY